MVVLAVTTAGKAAQEATMEGGAVQVAEALVQRVTSTVKSGTDVGLTALRVVRIMLIVMVP